MPEPSEQVDARVERSRAQLIDALRRMLRAGDARGLSISALCAEARVSRPTFYQHFATLDDVAVAGVEDRLARLRTGTGPEAVVQFLDALEADRELYRRALGSGTPFSRPRDVVEAWLAGRITDRFGDRVDPGAVWFAAAGVLGAVRAWLLQDPDDPARQPADALAETLWRLSGRVLDPDS